MLVIQILLRPRAYINRDETNSISTGGSGVGGVSTSVLAMGLDNAEMDSILGEGVVKQMFDNTTVPAPLQERLTALVSTLFIRSSVAGSLPAVQTFLGSDLSQIENQSGAGRAASSLGTTAAILGLLRGNALQQPISTIINTTTQLQSLNDTDKQNLQSGLQAITSTALLKLGLGSLVHETQTPGLLNVMDAAVISGTPQNANSRFGVVVTSLDNLKAAFGSQEVSSLLSQYLANQIVNAPGVSPTQVNDLANQIATNVTTEPTPATPAALQQIIQQSLASTLGSNVSSALVQQLTGQVSLFAIAGATRSDLLQNLISSAGPANAENLTDQTIVRLFGFSPSFGEGEIIQRPSEEATALPAVTSLADSAQALNNLDASKAGQMVADNFNTSRAHQDVQNLDAFFREVIDPGQMLVGLMYEGHRGTAFKRGKTDIDLA